MDTYYDVIFGNTAVGTVSLMKQGLYCKIQCKCTLLAAGIHKLFLRCYDTDRNLGVLIPDGKYLALETTIPSKYIDFACPMFFIAGAPKKQEGEFIPLVPDTEFAYIAQLENGRFEIRDGKQGVFLMH